MSMLATRSTHAGSDSWQVFTIGNICVSLQSDMPEALRDFTHLYQESWTSEGPVARGIAMKIRSSRRSLVGTERHSIWGDENEIFPNKRSKEVLPYLEWGINRRVLETRPEYLQFHAATLALEGQGFLFPAHSGSGKSTLAAGLLSRGWSYLTDELTLVDPDSLDVHPFPKALCIKAGSFDVVEKLGLRIWKARSYVKALKGRVGYIRPYAANSRVREGPTPIRFVIFPKYVEGMEPRVYPISGARAAFALASCALNRHMFSGQAMAIISNIVRRARCFQLECGPIDDTCDLVESLAASHRMEYPRCA